MIPRGSKWRGICAILLYQQWRDTHVNHFKSMSTAHEFCCFWETHFLFISNSDARGLCILTSCKSRCQSRFVYPNQFSKTYSTVHGWVDQSLSSETLRRSFSKQFQPTAEIKHNNSPVTSHLRTYCNNSSTTINFCSESHQNSPHFQPIFFLVKLQGLQGPPNLKPDITICVWLQQE